MKLESLRDLLVSQLQDLYDAEHQITKALPKMANAATSPELKTAFQKHLKESHHVALCLHRCDDVNPVQVLHDGWSGWSAL
jgi:ferritin-like metal-binding protein YciE